MSFLDHAYQIFQVTIMFVYLFLQNGMLLILTYWNFQFPYMDLLASLA